MIKRRGGNQIVLVGVLKNKRDLEILLTKNWYRIPITQAPKQPFDYLAFYQPVLFGREGKCIRYYARVLGSEMRPRSNLLPNEPKHPRYRKIYFCLQVGQVKKLRQPIKNIIPRRISFGFTTLDHFLKSKNILQLYRVAPLEQIMERGLKQANIKAIAQYFVSSGKKRYRLDFAAICRRGAIAIECDNRKAHSSSRQRQKDKIRDVFLKRRGWQVIRLPEKEILFNLRICLTRIKKAVRLSGGQRKTS